MNSSCSTAVRIARIKLVLYLLPWLFLPLIGSAQVQRHRTMGIQIRSEPGWPNLAYVTALQGEDESIAFEFFNDWTGQWKELAFIPGAAAPQYIVITAPTDWEARHGRRWMLIRCRTAQPLEGFLERLAPGVEAKKLPPE